VGPAAIEWVPAIWRPRYHPGQRKTTPDWRTTDVVPSVGLCRTIRAGTRFPLPLFGNAGPRGKAMRAGKKRRLTRHPAWADGRTTFCREPNCSRPAR